MKRTCPYCESKIKGKRLALHILEHKREIQEEPIKYSFKCFDNCTRICCTDTNLLISLTTGDIIRISNFLSIGTLKFFYKYCYVRLVGIRNKKIFTGVYLNRPCQFLENGKCLIYNVRPLSCRTFPDKFKIEPPSQAEDFNSYKKLGYKCIENDFELNEIEKNRLKILLKLMHNEIEKTKNYMGLFDANDHKEFINFVREFTVESSIGEYTPNGTPVYDAKYFDKINKKLWELKKEYYVNRIKGLEADDYRDEYDLLNY